MQLKSNVFIYFSIIPIRRHSDAGVPCDGITSAILSIAPCATLLGESVIFSSQLLTNLVTLSA